MRILLLGANGQVGHELLRSLSPLGTVLPSTRSGQLPGGGQSLCCDLSDPAAAAGLVHEHRPDLVVNAAAYTAVDRAEDEPELAMRANAEAVATLAEACAKTRTRLIHYSTDYVFPGEATRPYREHDATGPRSSYGRSKLAGEAAVRASGAEHLVIRLAWVYATRGHNFARTMLRLANERERLGIVADQVGAPTPARWIAEVTAAIAREPKALEGVVHLAAGGQTSWHGYADFLLRAAVRAGLLSRLPQLDALRSDQYPTPAVRPAYSCLDTTLLRERLGLELPDWREGVEQFIADLAARS